MATEMETTLTLFFDAGRMIRRRIEAAEGPLSFAQSEVLRYVEEEKRPTMRQVAGHLRITAPSASALCEGLSKAGFLERVADQTDRRQVRVSATRKGRAASRQGVVARKKALRQVLAALSLADHRDLQRILCKMLDTK